MRVLLATVGSGGDVYPFVAIARELQIRGHEPVLLASGAFADTARTAGIEFAEVGTADDYHAAIRNPDLWHPRRALPTLARMLEAGVPLQVNRLLDLHRPGNTIVVGSSLAFGARIVQDKLGGPSASVHLAPSLFESTHRMPELPAWPLPRWAPGVLHSLLLRVGHRLFVDPPMARAVDPVRREHGLPRVRGLLRDWLHAPSRTIGAFPDWFAPRQPDWPAQTGLAGFPLADSGVADSEPPPDVVDFLAAGDPPIVFTPGTAMMHADAFFRAAVDACESIDRRALLVTSHAGHLPAPLPASCLHATRVPFGWLFPRAAAVVCHGGIGTVAQGLQAGIPVLVTPFAYDQFDNASRLEDLGTGARLHPTRLTARRLARKLAALLDSPKVATACQATATRLAAENGLARMCDLIESAPAMEAPPMTG